MCGSAPSKGERAASATGTQVGREPGSPGQRLLSEGGKDLRGRCKVLFDTLGRTSSAGIQELSFPVPSTTSTPSERSCKEQAWSWAEQVGQTQKEGGARPWRKGEGWREEGAGDASLRAQTPDHPGLKSLQGGRDGARVRIQRRKDPESSNPPLVESGKDSGGKL